ncbi:type II toxin-antitoxin system HicB family antitoxin [Anaerobium acetethylicum]|uniref:Predicted nuclease of the RNAse H fold, HicB family n=1 Tax=Anaerobium acetethylicum TaxID=1619234 RepID=A0A1D3TZB9_9FIRM|nr:type II toxin-antitoxin system HicB family antitoxin [Anaerobium acetethylicum]SCP99898.1 Predicted nuclease of the RNAse H fold, HicB family [Anaerobium acetethylicum]
MNSMMEYKGYHATVEYDAEDGIFVGEVFGIVDSLNFHGSSVVELVNMFHQSIDNYLEICKKYGKEPNREFKGTFNVRITPELHRKIAFEATKQKITLNQYVAKALEESFDAPEVKETVIYVPYTTNQLLWNNEQIIPNESQYTNIINFRKKEELIYVEN